MPWSGSSTPPTRRSGECINRLLSADFVEKGRARRCARVSRHPDAGVVLCVRRYLGDVTGQSILRFLLPYAAGRNARGRGSTSLASLRRFCATAASRNSSLAPNGPRNRRRLRRRIRLRCANSISTFFRSRRDWRYSGVPARSLTASRAASWTLLGTLRCGCPGQHLVLRAHAAQSDCRAR